MSASRFIILPRLAVSVKLAETLLDELEDRPGTVVVDARGMVRHTANFVSAFVLGLYARGVRLFIVQGGSPGWQLDLRSRAFEERIGTALSQNPDKHPLCPECRMGLGTHDNRDPHCAHHGDIIPVEERIAEALRNHQLAKQYAGGDRRHECACGHIGADISVHQSQIVLDVLGVPDEKAA